MNDKGIRFQRVTEQKRIDQKYNSSQLLNYKNAKYLFDKTIAMWRVAFKKMGDDQLQVFMREIAEWSKDYR